MIFSYNKAHVGDVLMVIVTDSKDQKLSFERRGKVARVFLEDISQRKDQIFKETTPKKKESKSKKKED